jgi:hypothetical protein
MIRTRRVVVLALAAFLAASTGSQAAAEKKPKKPRLELRAMPRMSYSPVTIHVVAELKGGDDIEQYYCPEIEWEWGDGGKSVQEGDCSPFEPGVSKIGRRFTAEHHYKWSGGYRVSVRLRKADKSFAKADVSLTIRPGAGEGYRRDQ